MAIRLATREEAPRLAGIIRAAFRDVAERFGLTAETAPTHPSLCTAAWVERALDNGVTYYLGEDGARAWGCVALERATPDVCYLERLAVLPEFRRKGLGKALVDHVLTEAKALGARRVEIGIIAAHRELRDWYLRLGFRALKTVRFEHLPFTVMFMERALSGRSVTMEISVTRSTTIGQKPRPKDSELKFGKHTTDHLFIMDYTRGKGWHDPRIVPYQKLQLDPIAMVLHYSQQVFEGLKAYHLPDGGVALFRPDRNIARMNVSARRMVMPEVDPDLFFRGMKELILLECNWVPKSEGTSLYVRPTMIASEASLGVRPADQYLFYIVLCPVGAYYPEGFNPTRIFVTDQYVRAAHGGVGEAKTAGNYAASIFAATEATRLGYTQVLWLDARERRYVEEVGTSNIFFLINGELITPALGGTILPGITRDSVLHLARHWGVKVAERPISIDEVVSGCKSGAVKEMFASGTAAVISPVGEICYKGKDYKVGDGKTGELARRLYDEITGIQYGRKEDPFGWRVRLA